MVVCRKSNWYEVVVLGIHVLVGQSKRGIAPPGLWPRGVVSRMWWGAMSLNVCDRSPGLSHNIVQQKYAVVVRVVVWILVVL